jgi:hypothetical protein
MEFIETASCYGAYWTLVVGGFFSVLIIAVTVIQIIRGYLGKVEKMSYAYSLTYLLQNSVMLAIQIFLFRLLLAESISSLIILLLSFSVAFTEIFISRYHNKQWGF